MPFNTSSPFEPTKMATAITMTPSASAASTDLSENPTTSNTSTPRRCEEGKVLIEEKKSNSTISAESCSMENFLSAMQTQDFFPGKGRWRLPSQGFKQMQFIPSFCHHQRDTPLNLEQCFQRREWKKILTLGDSIGKRHYSALVSTLEKEGFVCSLVKREENTHKRRWGFLPDPEYLELNFNAKRDSWNWSSPLLQLWGKIQRTCEKFLQPIQIFSAYLNTLHNNNCHRILSDDREWFRYTWQKIKCSDWLKLHAPFFFRMYRFLQDQTAS